MHKYKFDVDYLHLKIKYIDYLPLHNGSRLLGGHVQKKLPNTLLQVAPAGHGFALHSFMSAITSVDLLQAYIILRTTHVFSYYRLNQYYIFMLHMY